MSSPHVLRFDEVRQELYPLVREYAVVLEAEKRARVAAIRTAQSSGFNIGATDQYVTMSTVDASVEVVNLRQEIAALEAERDDLKFLIEHGL